MQVAMSGAIRTKERPVGSSRTSMPPPNPTHLYTPPSVTRQKFPDRHRRVGETKPRAVSGPTPSVLLPGIFAFPYVTEPGATPVRSATTSVVVPDPCRGRPVPAIYRPSGDVKRGEADPTHSPEAAKREG